MPGNRYLRMLMAAGVTAGLACQSCETGGHLTEVSVVDRAAAKAADDPLALVVGVDPSGRLTLNQIEVGTTTDTAVLSGKLQAIFEDRRRLSIDATEIRVELAGEVAFDEVSALIASIKLLQPSRITVMTK